MSLENAKKAARHAAGEVDTGHSCQRANDINDMLGAAGMLPVSVLHANSADEHEDQSCGVHSEED
jgi:hypothetical protein